MLGLRYSPLAWNQAQNQFDFGGAHIAGVAADFTPHHFYVNCRAKSSGIAEPSALGRSLDYTKRDGKSWNTPYETIEEAITASNALIDWSASPWAPASTIHIAPGKYAENLTAMPYGAELRGYGDAFDADGERGVRIQPATGSAVAVTSIINCKILNINFQVLDTSKILEATNFNNCQVIHCAFQGPPEATTSVCAMSLTDTTALFIQGCQFFYIDCAIDWTSGGGPTATRTIIDNNWMSYISEAAIRFDSTTVINASMITRNFMCHGANGNTLAIGVDINVSTPDVGIYGNFISATDCIEGDTTGAYVGGNYCNGVLE